eukprot:404833-Prymnesium_polylepis.1
MAMRCAVLCQKADILSQLRPTHKLRVGGGAEAYDEYAAALEAMRREVAESEGRVDELQHGAALASARHAEARAAALAELEGAPAAALKPPEGGRNDRCWHSDACAMATQSEFESSSNEVW